MSESQPALKKCPECASMIPVEARKCAHCGYKFVHRSNIAAPIIMIIVVILVAVTLFGDAAAEALAIVFYLIMGAIVVGLILRGRRQKEESRSTEQSD